MFLELILDFRSPYSYLAHNALKTIGTEVNYTVVDALDVMKRVNNQPSQMCPPKTDYAMVDVGRFAAQERLPFSPNGDLFGAMRTWKIAPDLLLRVGLAAQRLGHVDGLADALFALVWASDDDVLTEQGRDAFAQKAQITPEIWSLAADEWIADELHSHSEHAAARGVFGVPTIFLDDEMFFGNDRMPLIRERLRAKGIVA